MAGYEGKEVTVQNLHLEVKMCGYLDSLKVGGVQFPIKEVKEDFVQICSFRQLRDWL